MKAILTLSYLILTIQCATGQKIRNQVTDVTIPIIRDTLSAYEATLSKIQPCGWPHIISCAQNLLQESTEWFATSDFFASSFANCVNYGPSAYDAPDQLYKFSLSNTTQVSITMEILTPTADLDLFLLSSCQPTNCILSSNGTTNLEVIEAQLTTGTYYIVVDGYNGSKGEFNIALSCNCDPVPLACNEAPLFASTVGQSNEYTTGSYAFCSGSPSDAYDAPDRIYLIDLPVATQVDIHMDILTSGKDLDLFLLDDCNIIGCLAASTSTSSSEDISIQLPRGEYYLVVDGYYNSQGDYSLQLSCDVDSVSTVCDFGGTIINLFEEHSGSFDVSDLAPNSLYGYQQIVNAYGGNYNIPNPLYADIYTFYNKPKVQVSFTPGDSTVKSFVFVCRHCSQDAVFPVGNCTSPAGCISEEFYWPPNYISENPCSDHYYVVVTGASGATYSNLRIVPIWSIDCPLPLNDTIACGLTITGTLPGGNGLLSTDAPSQLYQSCYNGSRLYYGIERYSPLILTQPSKITINFTSDNPLGMFLSSYSCGIGPGCIGYAENTAFDPNGSLTATLSEGIYYIFLDTENNGNVSNFSISMICEQYSPFVDEQTFLSGDFSNCPTDPVAIHQVSLNYDPTFAPSDYFNFYFRDTDGILKGNVEASQYWHNSTQPMPFQLHSDLNDGGEKCSYAAEDSFYIFIHQTENGKRTFRRFTPDFAQATGNIFQPGGYSQITKLTGAPIPVNFYAETSYMSVNPDDVTLPFAFITNLKWAVEKIDGPAPWLSITPTQSIGAETLELTFSANTSILPRSVVLRFYAVDQPDVYRQFVRIIQQGQCIIPQPVNIVPVATTVCLGSSLSLTADVGAPYQDLYNYLWSTGETTPSIVAIPPSPGNNNYSVTITNKHCFITSVDQQTVFVNDASSLVTQIALLSSIKCHGGNDGALSVGGTSTAPPLTYKWSNGATGQSISNLTAGIYTVTVTDGAGCEDVNTYTLNEPPAVAIANVTIVDATNGQNNGSVSVQVTGGTPGYTYQWLSAINNMPIAGQTQSTLTSSGPGNYKIQVTDANGCIFVSEAYKIDNISATNNPVLAAQIKSYPNPTSGKLYLQFNFTTQLETEIRLYDLLGREVFAASPGKVLSDLFEFDLSEAAAGLYLLKINLEDSFVNRIISLKK